MKNNKLDIIMLVAIGISAVVGPGIYNMPAETARQAGAFATIIAWVITFVGIMCLATVYKILADKKPGIKGGHFGYARDGFGDFIGGLVGWGYYITAIFTVIAAYIAISEVLVYFFEIFNGGAHSVETVKFVINTCAIWIVYRLLTTGIEEVGFASIIAAICKIILLVIALFLVFTAFSEVNFTNDFFGRLREKEIGGIYKQVESLANVNVWLLLGFEVIGVLSARAKSMKDIGNATIITALFSLVFYVVITLGTLGVMPTKELSLLAYPSMGGVLGSIIGNSGEIIVYFGILISAAGSLIVWTSGAVEIGYQTAKEGLFIPYFGKETNNIPKRSILATTIIIQIIVIAIYFYPKSYRAVYLTATSAALIPYLVSAMYSLKVILKEKSYKRDIDKTKDIIIATTSIVFVIWLIYSSLLVNVLYVMLIYALGVIIYMLSMKISKRKMFNENSAIAALIILVCGAFALYVLFFNVVK